jgi:GNAT superfamily N-acetyltransferase
MNSEIRKATLADSDQMFALVERFATSFRPLRMAFDHSLEHLLREDSVLINVAVFEDDVIGYCLAFDHYAFYANGRVTWVEEIMVREDLRRGGVGLAAR